MAALLFLHLPLLIARAAASSFQLAVVADVLNASQHVVFNASIPFSPLPSFTLLDGMALAARTFPGRFQYDTQQVGGTTFVTSIDQLPCTRERCWHYFLDGAEGRSAVDRVPMAPGVDFVWRLLAL